MKKIYLNEEKLPPKLPVSFSAKIKNEINMIRNYNHNNIDALSQWYEYIDNLKSYISNRKIAWDDVNRYSHFRNGAVHLVELEYDAYFIIKTSNTTHTNYVYVFKIDYQFNKFGLKRPPTLKENKKNSIRLTEAQFKRILTECITKIIKESKGHEPTKKIGKYNVIDGSWWDGLPHGLEQFGMVQDVRMYDNDLLKGEQFETYGLFRQISSKKYFYAKIVPIKGSKKTKWEPIHKEEVPNVILTDLKTINSEGHEPYLPF